MAETMIPLSGYISFIMMLLCGFSAFYVKTVGDRISEVRDEIKEVNKAMVAHIIDRKLHCPCPTAAAKGEGI